MPKLQDVWPDHADIIPLLSYSQFRYNELGFMTIDYQSIDIIFKRSGIDVSEQIFRDYRIVLNAFVAEKNKMMLESKSITRNNR